MINEGEIKGGMPYGDVSLAELARDADVPKKREPFGILIVEPVDTDRRKPHQRKGGVKWR